MGPLKYDYIMQLIILMAFIVLFKVLRGDLLQRSGHEPGDRRRILAPPGVNFTSILDAAFIYKSDLHMQLFFC